MPKFLDDMNSSEWIKTIGLVVTGVLLYADVQGGIKEQHLQNQTQNEKILTMEKKISETLIKQGEVNERIAETLSLMNQSLGKIDVSNQQLDKRIERIERKL